MRSPLEEARLKFQPPLPRQLHSVAIVEGKQTESIGNVSSYFPKTYGQPLLHFKEGERQEGRALRVGVLFSGGQAAGGHNVVTGLFDALPQKSRLFGFLGGPSGLIENRFIELDQETLASFRNLGGFDLIGSGRTKIETQEQFESARKNAQELNLDGLVIIGGDDSNTNAAFLAEFFLTHDCKTRVIGVPKTIDGDLKNAHVEVSFGFDSAAKTYSELIGNIERDALSAKKYYHFIKLMGRSASHITLECALQTHPNVALIGEEKWDLERITTYLVDTIQERAKRGKNYGVILVPEGLIEFVPHMEIGEIPKEIQAQLNLERDPHGNIQVSHIATEQLLIHLVKQRVKFNPVNHFFGYEGRSCLPSNFDATYCYNLGHVAAILIQAGRTGYMSTLHHLAEPVEKWEGGGIPLTMLMTLEERKGKLKPVIQKALVDLEGEPFKLFNAEREKWRLNDQYSYPGPIQFFGSPSLTDEITETLKLEQLKKNLLLGNV